MHTLTNALFLAAVWLIFTVADAVGFGDYPQG